MTTADDFLQMAYSDPQRTLTEAATYLEELDESQYYERSVTLRSLSLAARHTSRIAESITHARRASAVGREGGLERVALFGVLTETGSLAISGDLEGSLQTIESVLSAVEDAELRAEFEYQRAAVLAGMGHTVAAIESFEAVLPVYQGLGDAQSVLMTLNQLGRLRTSAGDLRQAEEALEQALSMARENSETASIPGILHNLGLLSAYQGDIPEALQRLYESDELYMEISGSNAPQHVARCEVLMSVGLFEEALETARSISRASAERDDREHQINALMVAARAALLAGHHAEAMQHADQAASGSGKGGDIPVLYEARAIGIEARLELDGPSDELLGDAITVAEMMTEEGLIVAATQVKFLAARISSEMGSDALTMRLLEEVAGAATGPVELRLQGALARARLGMIRGERGKALRAVRSGLSMIDRFQETLGATELRLGIENRGSELADTGLRLAVDSGRPREILEWLDRTRARALRLRPVTPVEDEEMRALLADMRHTGAELRKPSRRDDPELLARRRSLEQRIAAAGRIQRGTQTARAGFSVADLIEELGDAVLYEIGATDGRLFAILVDHGRARMITLGPLDEIERELMHLRFTMRSAARRGRTVDESVLEELSEGLFGDADFGDRHVVVVPPPRLMAVPWAALSPFRGRPIVVAPSAEMWWRAKHDRLVRSGVVVSAGPDLAGALEEIEAVGALYEDARIFSDDASVDEVRRELDGTGVAHIACHAGFRVENPMFSSLRLGDGDLNVYDIERLAMPPTLVVLSACDSGYTETRAGDELAGLTSALLSMGTRSVVASVGLVPDSPATSELMVELHKGLVAGLEPAKALATAQADAYEDPTRFVSAASFVCVGA
jgi:tetratricopeptide (TPR) repeat protein